MRRVHVICEGQTEETFVNEVLRPHLTQEFRILPIATLVGKPGHKGGAVTTSRMIADIGLRLRGDSDAWCTTFFDFYGLPASFVGKQEAGRQITSGRKAEAIQEALLRAVMQKTGANAVRRFIPYVQMHEFEGLLFSDPDRLAAELYFPRAQADLEAIRFSFPTPEDINDSPLTAPSKRILALVPGYQKPLHGNLAAIGIGLDAIRRECPLFAAWLEKLEALPALDDG